MTGPITPDHGWKLPPAEIEARSFAIIDAEAGPHQWDALCWPLVRRLVHTSADFDYVRDLAVSPGAVEAGIRALMDGADVLTDTRMALSGLNLGRLGGFGNKMECLIGDPEAVRRAAEGGLTRAMAAVDLALERGFGPAGAVWVVGNAPTALMRLLERLEGDPALPRPRLVVGLPVGFVNALESKLALAASGLPHVTNRSRKGGSNVAAAAVNALAAMARAGVRP
jgi:precorrin-8X/cobalt-precorrin-8 methylmutase